MAEAAKLLASAEGQQLLALLRQDGGNTLAQAAEAMRAGNTEGAKAILQPPAEYAGSGSSAGSAQQEAINLAELNDMLNGILSNPQAMQQIMALAPKHGPAKVKTARLSRPPHRLPPHLPRRCPSCPSSLSSLSTISAAGPRPIDLRFLQLSRQSGGDERQLALFQAIAFIRPDRAEKLGPGHSGSENLLPCRKCPAKARSSNLIRQVNRYVQSLHSPGDGTFSATASLSRILPGRPGRNPPPVRRRKSLAHRSRLGRLRPARRRNRPVDRRQAESPPMRSVFRDLLPKNMDTGDLLMLLILCFSFMTEPRIPPPL